MSDMISRQDAIDAFYKATGDGDKVEFCVSVIKGIPSVQTMFKTERLTNEDIKIIRIHINAVKECLCNQHRWKEAEDYQHIVNKLDKMMGVEHETDRC